MDIPEDFTEMDIMNLFLTEDFHQIITRETNRYAAQYLEQQLE